MYRCDGACRFVPCPSNAQAEPGDKEAVGGRIWDLDGDGQLDGVFSHTLGASLRVHWGAGVDGISQQASHYPAVRSSRSPAISDIDLDGDMDVLLMNFEDDSITLLPGMGDRSWGEPTRLDQGSRPRDLNICRLERRWETRFDDGGWRFNASL